MANALIPHVLHVGESHHPWQAPPIERLEVLGNTPDGVRVVPGTLPAVTPRPGQRVVNRPDHLVVCLPDEAAWVEVQAARALHQTTLDALAAALRDYGRYDERLAASQGDPNPLTPTVVHAWLPPDRYYAPTFFWDGAVPEIVRKRAEAHTPKRVSSGGVHLMQTHCYLCPDDAAWKHIAGLYQAAVSAAAAWRALLARLGTYAEARTDGRWTARATQVRA